MAQSKASKLRKAMARVTSPHTPYNAQADVAQMLRKIKGGFRAQKCNHNIRSPRCSFSQNGNCSVCGENIDSIRRKGEIYG